MRSPFSHARIVNIDTSKAKEVEGDHLAFNISGMLVWYAPPFTRKLPIYLAERMAEYSATSRRRALAYVVLVFYGLPAVIFFVSRWF